MPIPWLWEAVTHAHHPTQALATPFPIRAFSSPSSARTLLPWALPVASSRRSPVSLVLLPSFSGRCHRPAARGRARSKFSVLSCRLRSAFSTDMRFAPWRALRRRSRRVLEVHTASCADLPSSPHVAFPCFAQWIDFLLGSPAGCRAHAFSIIARCAPSGRPSPRPAGS